MLRQGCNSAIRFTVYGHMQKLWISQSLTKDTKISTPKVFLSGAFAGTVSTVLTMPIDVVKTRMQGVGASQEYPNVWKSLVKIFREEGLKALWKGTTPRLSRVMFSSGIVFSVQDFLISRMVQ